MPTVDEMITHGDTTRERVHPSPKLSTPPRPLVIVVGADKGGVGKTTVSRTAEDYLARYKSLHKTYDTEYPKGDLKRFVPAADIIDVTKVDDQMKAFDSVDGVTLVDIKAGQMSDLISAFGRTGLLDDIRGGELNLAVVHVLGQSVASLNEVAAMIAALGEGSHYYPVKNLIDTYGYEQWEKDPHFAKVLATLEPVTITVPHLETRAAIEVQQAAMGFDAFGLDARYSKMCRGYVRDWMKNVCAEYDRVGLGKLVRSASRVA
jgi:hypothetical protein